MKRSKAFVPAAETGKAPGDGKGQDITWKNKGGRNATTNEAKRGAGGVAPKPSGGAALLGNDRPSAPTTASMARVTDSPMGDSALRLPVSHPTANIAHKQIGQREADPGGPGKRISPQTRTPVTGNPVASNKPKRKGLGSAFYGE
jgi:hypothetical protein